MDRSFPTYVAAELHNRNKVDFSLRLQLGHNGYYRQQEVAYGHFIRSGFDKIIEKSRKENGARKRDSAVPSITGRDRANRFSFWFAL